MCVQLDRGAFEETVPFDLAAIPEEILLLVSDSSNMSPSYLQMTCMFCEFPDPCSDANVLIKYFVLN